MRYLQQSANLPGSCDYAARRVGADPDSIYRFVIDWDRGRISPERLRDQLEAIWRERVEDADAVQVVLGGAESTSGVCQNEEASGAKVEQCVAEILDEVVRNGFKPDPEGPRVVDMLSEDRNR